MKRGVSFIAGVAVGVAGAAVTKRALAPSATPPGPPPVTPPLDALNDAFHAAYDDARSAAEVEAPVFLLLGDVLFVHRAGATTEREVTPTAFHRIKSVAHGPVALYALLHGAVDRALPADVVRRLTRAQRTIRASYDEADGGDVAEVLRTSLEFIASALAAGRVSRRDLGAFADACGPLVRRLVEEATRVQLAALHAAVEEALAPLSAEERRAMQVVVAGDHQARARSLGMQYFQKRLGEPAGADERVTYAESIASLEEALALVGKRRFDRALAMAFFGDPKRLQQDVLGDAAADALGAATFEAIE